MSRTFRRKNYEITQNRSWDNQFRKQYGFYTTFDWNNTLHQKYSIRCYRMPTEQEFYKNYWINHSDNHRNKWSPSKTYRKIRMSENRSINNHELFKCLKYEDYEPLFEQNPRSCLWDWL